MPDALTRILVTGASGFVGGRVVSRARERGDAVTHGVGRRPLPDRDYTSHDLSQPLAQLRDAGFRPDVVIHAAARATPWGRDDDYHRDNVVATERVLEYCEAHGRPRLVYVSSSSVFYREGPQLGITEATPIGPDFVNRYAATKAAGEALVRQYTGSWAIARPRAVFGPGDTVLFPRILEAARRGRLPLFDTGRDGPAMGDLIYVDTLADYLLTLALRPGLTGDYNLTNAEAVPIQAFLLDVFARLGLPAPRRTVSVRWAMAAAGVTEMLWTLLRREGEPPITRFGVGVFAWSKTFDASRMLADLGPPSVSIAEGVDAFVRWQQAQWKASR
ncbi:MAG: NAD(P)-dependent oxidoreductase [Acidobacteria bacterium]|nr:NAD(P)-dependent oxidoreductase [Acidobacteriota bacterium]